MEEAKKKRSWWKIGCFAILVVVLIFAAIPAWLYLKYTRKVEVGEKRMLEYLEKKYSPQKFTIFEANYVWATKSWSFTVKDDEGNKFPAFIDSIYDNGIGDMYGIVREGREA